MRRVRRGLLQRAWTVLGPTARIEGIRRWIVQHDCDVPLVLVADAGPTTRTRYGDTLHRLLDDAHGLPGIGCSIELAATVGTPSLGCDLRASSSDHLLTLMETLGDSELLRATTASPAAGIMATGVRGALASPDADIPPAASLEADSSLDRSRLPRAIGGDAIRRLSWPGLGDG